MSQTTSPAPVSTASLRWGIGDAAAGYVIALFASGVLGTIWLSTTRSTELSLTGLAVAQVGLWAGFLGAPLFAAKRRGSGSLRDDFGLRIRAKDALVGIPIGLACQLVALPLLYLPISWLVDTSELSEPARELTGQAKGPAFAVLTVVLIVGAPVVEELFFRGLLLRACKRRWGSAGALAVTACVFGATHFQLLQFVGLAAFGAVLAWLALRYERLGPAIWAHAAFNAVTVAALFVER